MPYTAKKNSKFKVQNSKFTFKTLLRPSLTIVFAFIGALVARSGTPPEIFSVTGEVFLLVAVLAFGTLGFILPDLIELSGKAGVVAIARQIAIHIPKAPSTRLTVPKISFKRKSGSKLANPLIVDTSILVDGRIIDIAKSGFLLGILIILPAVIAELHALADSAVDLKRAKGRRGLEILEQLQREKKVKVQVWGSDPKGKDVDNMLLEIARKLKAKIMTTDFNLNKVATVKKIEVLNLNELANAVKTAVLPGDNLEIRIISAGKGREQGVGYVADGTMVVVEGGRSLVGQSVKVEVLRVIQTAAGKMIFGKVNSANKSE